MSESDRNDPLADWNLLPSEEPPARPSDATRSWPGRAHRPPPSPPTPGAAWDQTRSVADPDGLVAALDFTLNPRSGEDESHPRSPRGFDGTVAVAVASSPGASIAFPRCGEAIGGFRLVAEGRAAGSTSPRSRAWATARWR